MSQYYQGRRTKNIYDPDSKSFFRLSRSKIDCFIQCKRCFYLDRRLGLDKPPGFPFSLNSAVDALLKKEFDFHRANGSKHPLMETYGIDAVPFDHPSLDVWRENFKGVEVRHEATGFIVTGAVDDLWLDAEGRVIVVDYKATSKDGEVNLDAEWQDGYKRQMEVYQWLIQGNGFEVSPVGYFVYCNGKKDRKAFDAKLEFDVKVIAYEGDYSWVEGTLLDMKRCLDGDLPDYDSTCDYCIYRKAAIELEVLTAPQKSRTSKKPAVSKPSAGTLF